MFLQDKVVNHVRGWKRVQFWWFSIWLFSYYSPGIDYFLIVFVLQNRLMIFMLHMTDLIMSTLDTFFKNTYISLADSISKQWLCPQWCITKSNYTSPWFITIHASHYKDKFWISRSYLWTITFKCLKYIFQSLRTSHFSLSFVCFPQNF